MSKTAVQRRECTGGFEDAFKTMAVFVRSCRNGDRLFQAAGPEKLFTELVSCRWLLVAVTSWNGDGNVNGRRVLL